MCAGSTSRPLTGYMYELDRHQREAGRWALGQQMGKLANEFIEGELGWSSFEAREAQSKIRYFARVRAMAEGSWPKLILDMMQLCNIQTSSLRREPQLRIVYECADLQL